MYPKEFIKEQYLNPINIDEDTIEFKNLKDIGSEEFTDLVYLYMSIYNSDNVNLIKEHKFLGTTEEFGIWPEEPWDIKSSTELLTSFISDKDTIAIYACAKTTQNKEIVIGLSAYKHTNLEDFKNRGYDNPFSQVDINNMPLFYVMETFKRKFNNKDGTAIRYFSLKLKNKVNEFICNVHKEAVIFSSTNNKYMLNVFKKEKRTILEKPENKWGKYQGYLHLKCESMF